MKNNTSNEKSREPLHTLRYGNGLYLRNNPGVLCDSKTLPLKDRQPLVAAPDKNNLMMKENPNFILELRTEVVGQDDIAQTEGDEEERNPKTVYFISLH